MGEQRTLAEAIKQLRFNADFQRGYGSDCFFMQRDDADTILAELGRLAHRPQASEAVERAYDPYPEEGHCSACGEYVRDVSKCCLAATPNQPAAPAKSPAEVGREAIARVIALHGLAAWTAGRDAALAECASYARSSKHLVHPLFVPAIEGISHTLTPPDSLPAARGIDERGGE